jgi:hypothetical protein
MSSLSKDAGMKENGNLKNVKKERKNNELFIFLKIFYVEKCVYKHKKCISNS